jgi:serine/threonine-protein kinase HipA
MRKAEVYYQNELAGLLIETDEGHYIYQYTNNYIKQFPKQFISFTMPVRDEPYEDKKLFAFFEGLIPEGWLLDIASKSWKINPNDRMGLLMACCQNCIGAVSIKPITETNE